MNIDDYLGDKKRIEDAINDAYAEAPREETRRYIGASGVGNPCNQYLALCLRGYPESEIIPKLKRIFRDGHRIEEDVVADLKLAGYDVKEVDEVTGKQFRYSDFGNHVMGNADGNIVLDGINHILEIKSMNDARWKKCHKYGVKSSDPKYFAQMQLIMGLSQIHKSCFVSYNKNTSEYLSEIIDYDEFEYADLQRRIKIVLDGNERRLSTTATDWRCKTCFKRSACWEGETYPAACHNCSHAKPSQMGNKSWWCGKHDIEAVKICDDHNYYQPRPSVAS